MFGASLFIIGCSMRNRFKRSLRRLREPRYLAAVLAGAGYLYFILWSQLRVWSRQRTRSGRPGQSLQDAFPALGAAAPSLAGVGVLLAASIAWIFPGTGTLLEFSKSETQFLFPAPISARQLIAYRMMRSQFGVLFGAAIFGIVAPFGASGGGRLRIALTIWLLLFSSRVYASCVAVARAQMSSSSSRVRAAGRLPLILFLAAVGLVLVPLGRTLFGTPLAGANDALSRASSVLAEGLPRVAIWPFAAVVRPMFVDGWGEFAWTYLAAIAVTAALVVWLMSVDRTFEQLSHEVADVKKDQPKRRKAAYTARRAGWVLAPIGRPEAAFVWKGLLQTIRVVEIRILIRITIAVLWIATIASISGSGPAATLGTFAIIVGMIATVIGPLSMRVDLRQDLQHLEVLKTWPIRAAALVRGEMIWPGVVLTAVVWLMIGTAFYTSTAVFSTATLALRVSVAAAACLLAPALIAIQLAIHNTLALAFPAWVSFGSWRARGVDAVGQRLIVVGGTILMVAVAALPAALAGGLIWFAFGRLIGPVAIVPAAAVCAAIIGIEVLLVTEAVGPAYERLDLTSIERAES